MIELRMLGQIRLFREDGVDIESILRQPKRLALLAYLASPQPGTWHRRDLLLALFWPDMDTAHARNSLRSSLYVLRQSLGDDVVRTRGDDEISIDPEMLRTDLATVWDCLRNNRIDEALTEYRGELLPGLYPPDSEGFQRWLDLERARLKSSITVSATQHIERLAQNGNHLDALAIARRLIEVQPDDETVVRRAMSLHENIGDRAGGLALFESYRARLASDFDAEPAPETVAIAERLRATTPQAPRRKQAPVPITDVDKTARTVDIERRDEIPTHEATAPRSHRRRIIVPVSLALVAMLAIIAWVSTRPPKPLSIGNASPLTSSEGLQVEAAISPDGRQVAYAKGNTSRLRIFVQRIGGGQPWTLTSDSSAMEMMPRWAPKTDQILFLSRANAYVTPSAGGASRLVARGTPGDGMVRSASWSPTGDSVAIVRNDSLMVQPIHGTGSRYIGSGRQLHSCVWSPNESYIACVTGNWVAFEPGPLFGNEAQSGIVLFPAAGGGAIDVTGSEKQNLSPAWSADSRFLWFLSNRGGIPGEVYAISIGKDGHPSGAPVRYGLSAESIDLSANRIAYSVPVRKANVWSVPIPGDTPLKFADAKRVTSGTDLIEIVSVSFDGKWLVYDSNTSGNADIYRQRIDGGEPERLTDDPRPEYTGVLSPDGRELALHRHVDGKRRLFVKHLDTGVEETLNPYPGDIGSPHWSPDGKSLAAWRHEEESGTVFVMHQDANGKWTKPAWGLKPGQLPVWSPDGRTIAFVRYDGGIDLIPADSGARRNVYTRRPGTSDPIVSNIVWNANSPATLWFIGIDEHGFAAIWSVPVQGGLPKLRVNLEDPSGRLPGPSISSDGRNFYFTLDERFSNMRWAELKAR
jgi:Tol biopolymer transport system component/DNA-binding SARP family transcriptional activator